MVPSDPYGVQRPSGTQPKAAPRSRSLVVGPPCASAPLQRSSESHPQDAPLIAEAMLEPTHCLSWTSLPYGTCQRGGVRVGDASGAAASHVRGLGTPFAASPLGLATADFFRSRAPTDTTRVSERPWAFSFKGFPSDTIGASLEVRAFLPVPRAKAPSVDGSRDTRPPTRRLFPRRVRTRWLGRGRIP